MSLISSLDPFFLFSAYSILLYQFIPLPIFLFFFSFLLHNCHFLLFVLSLSPSLLSFLCLLCFYFSYVSLSLSFTPLLNFGHILFISSFILSPLPCFFTSTWLYPISFLFLFSFSSLSPFSSFPYHISLLASLFLPSFFSSLFLSSTSMYLLSLLLSSFFSLPPFSSFPHHISLLSSLLRPSLLLFFPSFFSSMEFHTSPLSPSFLCLLTFLLCSFLCDTFPSFPLRLHFPTVAFPPHE